MCLRHGNNNEAAFNSFICNNYSTISSYDGTTAYAGGIRIYGNYHKIHDNYIENSLGSGASGAMRIDGGDTDLSGELNAHWRVRNANVTNNILYNNFAGIEIGNSSTSDYQPIDCIFTNNKVSQNVNKCYTAANQVNSTWANNIAWPTGAAVAGYSNGVTVNNPSINYTSYESAALTSSQVGPDSL